MGLAGGKHALFLSALEKVCRISPAVAEAVLPLALYEAVSTGGAEFNNIAPLLTRYVLAPTCTLTEASRLGCAILVFFLRQEGHHFLRRGRVGLEPLQRWHFGF